MAFRIQIKIIQRQTVCFLNCRPTTQVQTNHWDLLQIRPYTNTSLTICPIFDIRSEPTKTKREQQLYLNRNQNIKWTLFVFVFVHLCVFIRVAQFSPFLGSFLWRSFITVLVLFHMISSAYFFSSQQSMVYFYFPSDFVMSYDDS